MNTQLRNQNPTCEKSPLFTHETVDGVTFVTLMPPKGMLREEEHFAAIDSGVRGLLQAADAGDTFMLELEQVTHMSSAFLATLSGLKLLADRNGRKIMLCRVQPQPMTILDLTRFRIFEIELANAPVEDPSGEIEVAA